MNLEIYIFLAEDHYIGAIKGFPSCATGDTPEEVEEILLDAFDTFRKKG